MESRNVTNVYPSTRPSTTDGRARQAASGVGTKKEPMKATKVQRTIRRRNRPTVANPAVAARRCRNASRPSSKTMSRNANSGPTPGNREPNAAAVGSNAMIDRLMGCSRLTTTPAETPYSGRATIKKGAGKKRSGKVVSAAAEKRPCSKVGNYEDAVYGGPGGCLPIDRLVCRCWLWMHDRGEARMLRHPVAGDSCSYMAFH